MRAFSLRLSPVVLSLLALLAATAGACGASKDVSDETFDPGGDDGGGITPGDGALDGPGGGFETGSELATLEPNNATVFIDTSVTPLVGGTQTFVFKKPGGEDITASATFTLEPSTLGTFSGATFTSVTDLPGGVLGLTGLVTATAPGQKAEAKVTVVKLRKSEDPTTKSKDFFFEEPYLGTPSPEEDVLKFTTQINQVDVVFAMDTTGSMSGARNGLRDAIKTTLIPELKKQIPSVGIGIAGYDDYPYSGYGYANWSGTECAASPVRGDLPVYVLQRITTDATAAANAADGLRLCAGADGPESQVPAMFHILTGDELTWPGGSVKKYTPKPGFSGGMDFRPGAVPVVVNITDANWHNGVGATYSFSAPTMAQLAAAFTKAGAKFVALNTTSSPDADSNKLSDDTNSKVPPSAFDGPGKPAGCGAGQCCTGSGGAGVAPVGGLCRLNFRVTASTSGVGTSVVTAIKAIASGSVYDLLPEVANDPANPDGVDAVSAFMDRLEAVAPGDPGAPAECAGTPRKSEPSKTYNDMIGGITAGKQVACFKVIPKKNTSVMPKATAQFFNAKIRMRGVAPGTTPVTASTPTIDLGDERTVLFYVPPQAPGGIK